MTFDSDSSEIYGKGVMKIPKAYNRQGVIWEKSRGPDYEICFWDWTGRLLYAMPRKQFLKLTAFPANIHPDASWPREKYASDLEYQLHQYLTDDGWTYTLEQAKETALKCGFVDIAAIYKTPNDGTDTITWVEITKENDVCSLGGATGTFDWGDGTQSQSSAVTGPSHTYADIGVYTVRISPASSTNIGRYVCNVTGTGYSGIYYLYTYSNAFGAGSEHDGVSTQILALYTGKATYQPGALYSSYVRYIGMIRDWDPFSNNYTDGCFESCSQLDTITFAPGATFPTYGNYESFVESLWSWARLYYQESAPWYVVAFQARMIRNIFLPYGWTGHKTAMANRVTTDTPFIYYGALGTNGLWTLSPDAPNRLIYPPTTEALFNAPNLMMKDSVSIGAESLTKSPINHSIGSEAVYYVPSETLDYYASILPNGQTLKESGRIVEVT